MTAARTPVRTAALLLLPLALGACSGDAVIEEPADAASLAPVGVTATLRQHRPQYPDL